MFGPTKERVTSRDQPMVKELLGGYAVSSKLGWGWVRKEKREAREAREQRRGLYFRGCLPFTYFLEIRPPVG